MACWLNRWSNIVIPHFVFLIYYFISKPWLLCISCCVVCSHVWNFWLILILSWLKSSYAGSGVSTDIWTSYAARIMVLSIVPFLIVQLPQALNSTSGRHLAVLIALIVSVCLLISYCLYQVVFFLWYTCSSALQ